MPRLLIVIEPIESCCHDCYWFRDPEGNPSARNYNPDAWRCVEPSVGERIIEGHPGKAFPPSCPLLKIYPGQKK